MCIVDYNHLRGKLLITIHGISPPFEVAIAFLMNTYNTAVSQADSWLQQHSYVKKLIHCNSQFNWQRTGPNKIIAYY